jgi:hypothetical protein
MNIPEVESDFAMNTRYYLKPQKMQFCFTLKGI